MFCVCVLSLGRDKRLLHLYLQVYTQNRKDTSKASPSIMNSLASDSKIHFLFYKHSLPDLDVKVIFQEISNCVLCYSPNLHLAGQWTHIASNHTHQALLVHQEESPVPEKRTDPRHEMELKKQTVIRQGL